MVSKDCPGRNKDGEKSEIMRSFIVPSCLTTPEARQLKQEQTINIFAAFVGLRDTFIVTDHSRLLRMHIMILPRCFTQRDLEPESEVRAFPLLYVIHSGVEAIDISCGRSCGRLTTVLIGSLNVQQLNEHWTHGEIRSLAVRLVFYVNNRPFDSVFTMTRHPLETAWSHSSVNRTQ